MINIFVVFDIYKPVLKSFISKHELNEHSYDQIIDKLGEFSISTGYSWYKNLHLNYNLNVTPIVYNSKEIQLIWLKKNNLKNINNLKNNEDFFNQQIEYIKPEVIFFNNFNSLPNRSYIELKEKYSFIKLLITWDGILGNAEKLKVFDIILSPLHYLTKYYNSNSIRAYYMPLAYQNFLKNTIEDKKIYDVSFVGSINLFKSGHFRRLEFLYRLSKKNKIKMFLANMGYYRIMISLFRCLIKFDFNSAFYLIILKLKSSKPKLGIEMLRAIKLSKISLNFHIDVAKNEAANLRMYEVTGSGSCLLTDYKDNINEIFIDGEEIMTFKNVDECSRKIDFLLSNNKILKKISKQGQRRTLSDHSFKNRSEDLVKIILKNLKIEN